VKGKSVKIDFEGFKVQIRSKLLLFDLGQLYSQETLRLMANKKGIDVKVLVDRIYESALAGPV
jgi:hypothetical protein